MTLPERYKKHRDVMFLKHGYCGPYRLGIAVGESGEDLPSPYTTERSTLSYEQGKEVGKRKRAAGVAGMDGQTVCADESNREQT